MAYLMSLCTTCVAHNGPLAAWKGQPVEGAQTVMFRPPRPLLDMTLCALMKASKLGLGLNQNPQFANAAVVHSWWLLLRDAYMMQLSIMVELLLCSRLLHLV
jgi:hypothetical protein